MPVSCSDPRAAALVAAYEGLTRDSLPTLLALYAEQARFKDPFNEVRGRAAIEQVFAHMFNTLREPRFTVTLCTCEGDHAFLTWDFRFLRERGEPLLVRGASHLSFQPDGLVALHRDYWDAAEELYAKLPLLGVLMRALQKRLRA
ncbi:MAG: isomerase [Roseateles depolymerans]|uniref:Isomerase n=1 Tax=Roseateles depolymerans TaxID=76731 RepID=A0A2W5DXR6_9BURK|nr:MAG: isomerase [Roseateles depolymerans]